MGLSVCEDVWHAGRPFSDYRGVPLVTNINGSPYHRRKLEERLGVLRDRAREFGGWIAYVNAVGGQDEPCSTAARWSWDRTARRVPGAVLRGGPADRRRRRRRSPRGADATWIGPPASIYGALVVGLRDYVRKNGFDDVVLGLSGGIDSAFVAVLAADALGPDSVHVLAMPSPYSSPESLEDAADVAGRLHPARHCVDRSRLRRVSIDSGALFEGRQEDVTEENLQARIRGNLLMAVSNKFGSLVLATGNKSEYAVGYSTLYGTWPAGSRQRTSRRPSSTSSPGGGTRRTPVSRSRSPS